MPSSDLVYDVHQGTLAEGLLITNGVYFDSYH